MWIMRSLLALIILIEIAASSFINPYPRFKEFNDGGDPGEPLFLTPLINQGKIDEAVKAAEVTGTQFKWVKSYSGYLTVNKNYNSNMFFWYFPPEINTIEAPVILWLQGGPGASSLFGLFAEHGPFAIGKDGNIEKREIHWSKNHHVIYIDNPVGTGFSFTDQDEGYAKNEKDVGKNLYEAITQIFKLFPVFQHLNFWIMGESYAGKYVPALAFKIHSMKKKALKTGIKGEVKINFVGMAIGNGFSDPLHQLKYSDYLYQIGLIDIHGRDLFYEYEKNGTKCIKERNMDCAFEIFDTLINMDQKESSVFQNLTGYSNYFNYLKTKPEDFGDMGAFIQSSEARKAIHVGNKTFHDLEGENKVEIHLKNDIMDSVALWVAELLKSYKVCVYSGQLDVIVAYPLTLNYLQRLKFSGQNIYKNAPRNIWNVDGEIAGYIKEAGNLVEILIRNAGHMAPSDQPKWVFDMITRLTHGKNFV